MLKIRDDVALKELEKFKFEYNGLFWYKKDIFRMGLDVVSIGINKDNRTIQLGWCVGSSCAYTYDLGVLFDLIQAGLVEKVVEE